MARQLKPAPDPWWRPRLTPGFVVLCVVVMGAMAGLVLTRLQAGILPLMLGLWVPALVIGQQRRRIANRVLIRTGVTCPCCLRVLPEDAPDCPYCDAGLGRSVYVDYWTLASNEPRKSEAWWRSQNEAKGQRGRATHLTVSCLWQLGFLLGCFVLTCGALILWRPAILLTMQWLWMLPIVVTTACGVWIMTRMGRRRLGDSVHCARCEYQIDPTRLSMSTCPECGGGLSERGQTVVGRRVGHGGYTLLGILIFILPVLLPMVPLLTGGFGKLSPSNYLPVSLYVDDALGGDPDYKTWDVLESRYAKPEDVQRLVEAMLVKLQSSPDEDGLGLGTRLDHVLAFQLNRPQVSDDLKHRLAIELLKPPHQSRLYILYDWLATYAKSTTRGSSERRELLDAARDAFAAGSLHYEVTNWLEAHGHQQLRAAWSLENFFAFMLRFDRVTTNDGPMLHIWQHPGITLNADQRPRRPVRVYLHTVHPNYTPSPTTMILDIQYDPITRIGNGSVIASLPDTTDPSWPASSRLIFLVAVGDDLPNANEIRWVGDQPLLTHGQETDPDWYGPYQIHVGSIISSELQ